MAAVGADILEETGVLVVLAPLCGRGCETNLKAAARPEMERGKR